MILKHLAFLLCRSWNTLFICCLLIYHTVSLLITNSSFCFICQVASLRASISSFQEQASCKPNVPAVVVAYKLCQSFNLQKPLSSPLKVIGLLAILLKVHYICFSCNVSSLCLLKYVFSLHLAILVVVLADWLVLQSAML